MEILSKNLRETEAAAQVFLEKLAPRQGGATIVALAGDLGSGKTTFVQSVAKILGVKEHVASPTFVLIKTYQLTNFKTYKLITHVDAYRLKNAAELIKLGWQEVAADPKNLIFIEWPENVAGVIPEDTVKIKFSFVNENTRKIDFI